MKNFLFFLLIITAIVSCNKSNRLEKEIALINTDIEVERFDRYVAQASLNDFPKLKKAYPFMFSENESDSSWVETKRDTFQIQLFTEVDKIFGDFKKNEEEIESFFNHVKYYFSEFNLPRIITTTNYVRFRNRTIVTDTIVVLALDSYLGSDHEFYGNIQKFITANLNQEQIVVDLAGEYAKKFIYQKQNKTLLDEMIYHGKQLYFKDRLVPFKTEAQRIGYTPKQMEWAKINESDIWRYFVERELLFSTDSKLPSRFINPAPFTKFYIEEIDADSPGRIGQFVGWQIVRSFMNQNEVSLKEMLVKSPEEIYNNTKYKPKR
ncbi:gliding motility lipoprotein GldB [Seonamhaeicola sp. MEBiC1930]|uniref:gliding motility lipoprotein GldB n=1 Tax=Seonamhaeicola sp. MEBiC01930 TaxID=2976768 RepID=UPI0032558C0C